MNLTFEKFFEESIKPMISAEILSKKYNRSIDEINKLLDIGQKVEMEHTTDRTTARTIVSHHLNELIDYYSRLKKVEKD